MTTFLTSKRRGSTLPPSLRRLPLLLVALLAVLPARAFATAPSPGWELDSQAAPTNFSPAQNAECVAGNTCDAYQVTATNAGSRPTDGTPITLSDTLPAGLTVQRIALYWWGPGAKASGLQEDNLAQVCDTATVSCAFPLTLQPDDSL